MTILPANRTVHMKPAQATILIRIWQPSFASLFCFSSSDFVNIPTKFMASAPIAATGADAHSFPGGSIYNKAALNKMYLLLIWQSWLLFLVLAPSTLTTIYLLRPVAQWYAFYLSYSANFASGTPNPEGSGYHWCPNMTGFPPIKFRVPSIKVIFRPVRPQARPQSLVSLLICRFLHVSSCQVLFVKVLRTK